jgi:hypothetical protein
MLSANHDNMVKRKFLPLFAVLEANDGKIE